MSQTSYVFNKPIPYTTTIITATANVGPPDWVPQYTYAASSTSGTTLQAEWKALYVGTSVKTPKPWPLGRPGLKQWNSYTWTKKNFQESWSRAQSESLTPPFGGQQRVRIMEGGFNHCFPSEPYPTLTLEPNVSRATQRLLAKIKGQEWNVGENLGEIEQTAGLIVNSMKRIARAILAVKQGKTSKAMEILRIRTKQALGPAQKRAINRKYRTQRERQIASDWLAINYGVIPLMSDVQAAIQHVQNRADWPIQTQASVTESVSAKSAASTLAGSLPGLTSYVGSVNIVCKTKYIVQYVVDGPTIAYFRSLGLTNVPSLAWELTPGSLVADWFLPIGTWLSNMDATLGCTFSKGVLVKKTTSRYEVEAWLTSTSTAAATGAGKKVWFVESYVRNKILSFPTNFFPQFKNPVSAKHSANALAFLVQAVHR